MNILNFIATSNFITVNKLFIKEFGIDEAILIGEFASEYDYWQKRKELEDGWFYSTIENVESNTGLSDFKQRKAIKNLQEREIIDIKVKGVPAKRYIKINENQVLKLFENQFFNNSKTSSLIIQELDIEKLKGNNNIYNNNKNNNIYNKAEKKFKKPTLDEVKEYCKERNNDIDAETFINFYEAKGWKIGKSAMKDWKACIRTWEKNNRANQSILKIKEPEWFNKENKSKKMTKEETKELENILNDYK